MLLLLLDRAKRPGRALSRTGTLAFVALLASIPQGSAQVPERPGILQVELLIQRDGGKPVTGLTARDFAVDLNGAPLLPELIRPHLGDKPVGGVTDHTRMIVILGPGPGSSPSMLRQLSDALAPVWQLGWQVAVARSDGSVTDYAVSPAQFQQISTAPPQASGPAAEGSTPAEQAMLNLKFFRGRRILLFLSGTATDHQPPPYALMRHVRWDSAETLIVDGGVPGQEYDVGGEHSGGPYAMQTYSSGFDGGAFHETSVQMAVKQALRDAAGFYVLRFHVLPANPAAPKPALTVRILKPGQLMVMSRLYPVSATAPTLQVLTER